jgi:hypothetical protein
MQFKLPHVTGLALSGAGVLAAVGSGLHWFSSNVTVDGSRVCADGLPSGAVGLVSGALAIAGTLVLVLAPSINTKTNVAAVNAVPGMKAGPV